MELLASSIDLQGSLEDDEITKLNILYGSGSNNLASILAKRSLFLEKLMIMPRIARDVSVLYSYSCDYPNSIVIGGILSECLIKLLSLPPMKSFLRLTFCQIVNHITYQSTGKNSLDISHLTSFVNELRLSYSTLCLEDRAALKPNSRTIHNNTLVQDAKADAAFLINWAIVESSKYCISHKFSPEMSATTFLDLLQKLTMLPVSIGDIVSRRSLIYLLQNLDKLLQDRILDSATGLHTFTFSNNIESFYQTNCPVFRSWFTKNRQSIARLSLASNEYAECWRNMNLKLGCDLATKMNGLKSNRNPTLSQTLMSINTQNWYYNLNLLTKSAKQLKDLPQLYGIQALIERGIICNFPPLSAIILNIKGNYESTIEHVIKLDDKIEPLVEEFLEACIELDRLEENSDVICKLKSKSMKDLYTNYLISKRDQSMPNSNMIEVKNWLQSWPALNDTNSENAGTIKHCLDLIIPTCLNIVSKTPQSERKPLLDRIETVIGQDLIQQNTFTPFLLNNNLKVYYALLNILKKESKLDPILIETHRNDAHWNHLMFRHLNDLDLIGPLRNENNLIDCIQLRAAKYHQKSKNFIKAAEIVNDLRKNTTSLNLKIESSFILIKKDSFMQENSNELFNVAKEIKLAELAKVDKYNLIAKVSRFCLKSHSVSQATEAELIDLLDDDVASKTNCEIMLNHNTVNKWKSLIELSSIEAKTKTYIYLSARLNECAAISAVNTDLLVESFNMDMQLLELLNQSNVEKHQSVALECATRLIRQITSNSKRLNEDNLEHFTSTKFVKATLNSWLFLKTNLISIVVYQNDENLTNNWKSAIVNILKVIVMEYPSLLIYSIIVNRLDLQNELLNLNDESLCSNQEPCALILQSSKETTESRILKLNDCHVKLSFWNELLDVSKTNGYYQSNWCDILNETECFLKEIRRISFLCGEYFKTLTLRIPKRLFNFLDYCSRHCEADEIQGKHRLEECEKRLKCICNHAINQIKVLTRYNKKTSSGDTDTTKYDLWFCETFNRHLLELELKLDDLCRKRPLIYSELESSIKIITDSLATCKQTLLEYNHNNRQKLFMELISPKLSRLEPSFIPMPDYCEDIRKLNKPFVTIHKISQTINLIVSKTSPKKLQFIGSDGITRSYLLKAHEDLRLDKLIMDLFSVINKLFLRNKSTQNKYKLRKYSVTPVSTRSALIQWIEAPSLCSFYRAWLSSSNGKKVIDELFETTCSSLCGEYHNLLPRAQHVRCQPTQSFQTTDIFYQLLWAKIKPFKVPLAQVRPTFGNIIRYHNQFDPSVFECVVDQLISRMPNELVSNQLWYKSNNSHSYWFKTREFTNSVATISMIGYIIGLGDRHPENILLDLTTGEVVHIDYNICFELGKTLSIPEQVPFRLTQNIIHAFGFAGLEGGFTAACCDVLDTLKSYQTTLLHLLDPVNLSFMIGQPSKMDEVKDTSRLALLRVNNESKSKLSISSAINQPELDMCSQESVELNSLKNDVNDLLILNNSPKDVQVCDEIKVIKPSKSQMPHSFDVQHNIETPTKILWKTAVNIHKRISNKLTGADESLHHYGYLEKYEKLPVTHEQTTRLAIKKDERANDLIMLSDAQITKNQVTGLILEATSLKNKAAMFEGWVPWI